VNIITPLSISVQDFAFRGSLRLALQSPARSNCIHESYFYHRHKKIRANWIYRSDLPLIKLLMSPPINADKKQIYRLIFCYFSLKAIFKPISVKIEPCTRLSRLDRAGDFRKNSPTFPANRLINVKIISA
jgi:hypothetical protein